LKKRQPLLYPSAIFHDRYRIQNPIGSGGMGNVYLAEDLRLKGKKWAIKEIALTQSGYQQFLDEANMLIALNHPYLPNIVDYYPPDEEGYCYLVMDYIQGETLLDVFEKEDRKLSYPRVIQYALQLSDLFDYLHNQQPKPIIYRDLKPNNVMIDEQDHVRLIDFGIARNYKEGKESDTIPLGTVGFAAPEQFEKKQTDHRSDIYTLGALMYFLLTEGNHYSIQQKSLAEIRRDLPSELVAIIQKMLQFDPTDRYQNIVEVKQALRCLTDVDQAETEWLTEELAVKHPVTLSLHEKKAAKPYQEIYTSIPPKLVIIANLSKRAGSSFITINLAKLLSELKILTSVLEVPFDPYLYDNVGLEQRLAKGDPFAFYSIPHAVFQNERVERDKGNVDDGMIWMVANPSKPLIQPEQWTFQHMIKYVSLSKKANISLLDAGSYLEHPSIAPLIEEADLILIVLDPMPREILFHHKQLAGWNEMKKEGFPIEFVYNYWTKGINEKEFNEVVRVKPIARISAIDLTDIHQASYQCNIPYEYPPIKSQLEKPLLQIVQYIVPKQFLSKQLMARQEKKPWFIGWKRKEG